MCGLSGFWSDAAASEEALTAIGQSMAARLVHRGPDAGDLWVDTAAALVLSHRRLSILDLSDEGAQPMASASGRYVIVYNGEIYNHLDLRARLEAEGHDVAWRGHSDTETLLAAIEAWGLETALSDAAGMYALALWDCEARALCLARDPMGEKPLYYGRAGTGFAFASEVSAFHALPEFASDLDSAALRGLLTYAYVPEPHAIYTGIQKLAPGAILRITGPSKDGMRINPPGFFIDLADTASRAPRLNTSFDAQSRALEDLLLEVVGSQMISDVPLGSFLSGGIDSSLVTALMQGVSDRPVKSFSIGFADSEFDESQHAAAVAQHLGTDHTEFRLTEDDALHLIPELTKIYAEPFADSSQIPTALLCREARAHVTVALTGDGGDEVFGGYNRHILGPRALARASAVPRPLRRLMGPTARLVHRLGGSDSALLRAAISRAGLTPGTLNKIARLGEALGGSESLEDLYKALTIVGPGAALLKQTAQEEAEAGGSPDAFDQLAPAEWLMAMDSLRYLPGDILVKVDRAAMAASLETRAPFLDRRVIAAAWDLPLSSKIEGGIGKRILRDILNLHVPRHLIDRPKQGFAIPIDRWLRGALQSWAEDLLARDRLEDMDVFDVDAVRTLWSNHLKGSSNEGQALWPVLMLMAWLEDTSIETKEQQAAA